MDKIYFAPLCFEKLPGDAYDSTLQYHPLI